MQYQQGFPATTAPKMRNCAPKMRSFAPKMRSRLESHFFIYVSDYIRYFRFLYSTIYSFTILYF